MKKILICILVLMFLLVSCTNNTPEPRRCNNGDRVDNNNMCLEDYKYKDSFNIYSEGFGDTADCNVELRKKGIDKFVCKGEIGSMGYMCSQFDYKNTICKPGQNSVVDLYCDCVYSKE